MNRKLVKKELRKEGIDILKKISSNPNKKEVK